MEKYFISDTHFLHDNYHLNESGKSVNFNRPFNNVNEADAAMIKNWQKVVPDYAEVFHLGDFFCPKRNGVIDEKRAQAILDSLPGKITLLIGNHDVPLLEKKWFTSRFADINHYLEFNKTLQWGDSLYKQDYHFVLFHYPIEHWHRDKYGSIHIHGHTHSKISQSLQNIHKTRVNVCVEAIDYTPKSIYSIIENIDTN